MNTTHKPTRGERNNNPLNIRWSASIKWQGQIYHDDAGFCTFRSNLYGTRAAFAILRTYRHIHHRTTIEQIIERWAPPTENNTAKYVADVCKSLNACPSTIIDYRGQSGRQLVKAMAVIESNMVLDDDLLVKAQQMI